MSTTVASHTRLQPLYQGPKVMPCGLLPSLVRPTSSQVEGRPMRVNDLLRMELMAECLGKRPAFLVQERPWSPSLSTILPQRHFVPSKILAPVWRAIAIRSSSGLSKFLTLAIRNASDQVAVSQCDSLVQQVTDSGSKGYWCLAENWVNPYSRGHPRLLLLYSVF